MLLFWLFPLCCLGVGSRVIWGPSKPWEADDGSRFLLCKGVLIVPASYEEDSGEHITVYIERFQRLSSQQGRSDKPRHHLILLSGGPGQSGALWRHELPPLVRRIPKKSHPGLCFYTIHLRGIGKSSKAFGPVKREKWQDSFKPPHSLARYSISNAARDVASLARLVKRRPTDHFTLFGVSFGGFLAARTVTMFPDLFDWLIVDSPSMRTGRFSSANDDQFWRNCLEDEKCQEMVGSVRGIRRMYHRIVTGRRPNACIKTAEQKGRIEEWLWPLLRGEVSDASSPYYHPAMLAIPIILHLYHCPSSHYFGHVMVPQIEEIRHKGRISVREGRAEEDRDFSIEPFYNSYILTSELIKYPKVPEECAGTSHLITVTNQCYVWERYLSDYKILKDHLYPLDQYRDNRIDSSRTKLVVLTGGMDLVTPPRLAINWSQTLTVPKKIMLHWTTRGHVVTPEAPCLEHMFAVVLATEKTKQRSYQRRLANCIARANKEARLDWHFKSDEYSFARDWCDLLDR